MDATFSTIIDFLTGINFKPKANKITHYFFQWINHLFALTYVSFIATSLFGVIATIIIFVFKLDLRMLINDSQLIQILTIYLTSILLICAMISLRNTVLSLRQIEHKDSYQKYIWMAFLITHLTYAGVILTLGLL